MIFLMQKAKSFPNKCLRDADPILSLL